MLVDEKWYRKEQACFMNPALRVEGTLSNLKSCAEECSNSIDCHAFMYFNSLCHLIGALEETNSWIQTGICLNDIYFNMDVEINELLARGKLIIIAI